MRSRALSGTSQRVAGALRADVEPTYLAADTAVMAEQPPKPQSTPPLAFWNIYRVAKKARLLGTVEADNAGEAIKKAAAQFKVIASKLIAVPRR
jgi:hypothetical protein